MKTSDWKQRQLPPSPERELEQGELAWGGAAVEARLAVVSAFRGALFRQRDRLLEHLQVLRPAASRGELLSSEFLPLLDACRFLESSAAEILAPRQLGKVGQPAWLRGVENTVYLEPLGRILILAPSNYPLFLPIVQAVYAWVAGNSVWLKSAPGGQALHQEVREMFLESGGGPEQFRLLGEAIDAYSENLPFVHKVVLVGSAQTGRTVLAQAGEALVPAVAELSGWDAVFVHPGADMDRAARSVAFGLSLNRGKTCVAPRRVFFRGDIGAFEHFFQEAIQRRPHEPLDPAERHLVSEQVDHGARLLCREIGFGPVLLSRVSHQNEGLNRESFGALAVLVVVESDEEALALARACPYRLGASLFGPEDWCRDMAHRVPAQVVSINDAVVPTADPRVPFGGSRRSGYGRMRGPEGLLEMTQTRTVCLRRGGRPDHLLDPGPADDTIVENFLRMSHAEGWLERAGGLARVVWAVARERWRKWRAGERRDL